jgi:hypothetical protein
VVWSEAIYVKLAVDFSRSYFAPILSVNEEQGLGADEFII